MKAAIATHCYFTRAALTPQRCVRLALVQAKKTCLTTRSRRQAFGSSPKQKLSESPSNNINNNNNSNVNIPTSSATAATQQETASDKYVIPKSFAIGSVAGILGSLAGMGGGFVMIPLMTSRLLNLTQHQAHGTSLFAVAATGVAGALGYEGYVQYDAAAAIAACGIMTAGIGASVTTHLSSGSLRKALGVFMIFVAPLVPLKGYLQGYDRDENDDDDVVDKETPLATSTSSWHHRLLPPAIIGLGSGFLAGLFGVGGGAVVVPALTIFTDVNHYQALGTSLCAMTFPAISGTLTHFRKGNVAMRVAPALATGAFCGGYLGGRLGLNINEDALRWGFSGLMVTLGVRTLIR